MSNSRRPITANNAALARLMPSGISPAVSVSELSLRPMLPPVLQEQKLTPISIKIKPPKPNPKKTPANLREDLQKEIWNKTLIFYQTNGQKVPNEVLSSVVPILQDKHGNTKRGLILLNGIQFTVVSQRENIVLNRKRIIPESFYTPKIGRPATILEIQCLIAEIMARPRLPIAPETEAVSVSNKKLKTSEEDLRKLSNDWCDSVFELPEIAKPSESVDKNPVSPISQLGIFAQSTQSPLQSSVAFDSEFPDLPDLVDLTKVKSFNPLTPDDFFIDTEFEGLPVPEKSTLLEEYTSAPKRPRS